MGSFARVAHKVCGKEIAGALPCALRCHCRVVGRTGFALELSPHPTVVAPMISDNDGDSAVPNTA